jgi:hypothetical protein
MRGRSLLAPVSLFDWVAERIADAANHIRCTSQPCC